MLGSVSAIRHCRDDDRATILAIVNAAAEAYRSVIPADRWHDPYMPLEELDGEIGRADLQHPAFRPASPYDPRRASIVRAHKMRDRKFSKH